MTDATMPRNPPTAARGTPDPIKALIDLLANSARQPRPSRPEVVAVSDPTVPGRTGIVIHAPTINDVLAEVERQMWLAGDALCRFTQPQRSGDGGWMCVGTIERLTEAAR